jgi:hypothetical protein
MTEGAIGQPLGGESGGAFFCLGIDLDHIVLGNPRQTEENIAWHHRL